MYTVNIQISPRGLSKFFGIYPGDLFKVGAFICLTPGAYSRTYNVYCSNECQNIKFKYEITDIYTVTEIVIITYLICDARHDLHEKIFIVFNRLK